jgi:hypothetical protein
MKLKPTFPNMLPGEQVVLMLHRHGIVAFRILTLFVILTLIPVGGWALIAKGTTILSDDTTLTYAIVTMVIAAYALIWGLLLFIAWLNYYLDVWIVSNERIINIKQLRLFDRVVSEQKLYRVQDVTWEIKGILGNMLKFGKVTIQTAGELEKFSFDDIPDPEAVAKSIMHLLEQIENQLGANTMAKLDGDLVEGMLQPAGKPTPEPPSAPPAGAAPPSVKL